MAELPETNVDYSINEKTFLEYKDKYSGKGVTAFLLGTGRTLRIFKKKELNNVENKIVVGVNEVPYVKPNLHLDYYFFGHRTKIYKPFIKKAPKNGQVRFGLTANTDYTDPEHIKALSPQSEINKMQGHAFINSWSFPINKDIAHYPTRAGSIIFSAFQFLAYAGITDIVLIGCDCDGRYRRVAGRWKETSQIYPEVKIRVLRPVGLRGIFPKFNP